MKVRTMLMFLLAALLLTVPYALAEESDATEYAPIEPWLINNHPAPAPYLPHEDCFLPNNAGYEDPSLSISVETSYWTQDIQQVDEPADGVTRVLATRVKLMDVSQFRTALALKYPSKGSLRVMEMGKRNNAVLAINGDYFNFHSNGITYRNGRRMRFAPNGKRDLLIVDTNGDFHTLRPCTKEAFEEFEATGLTALHTFWFGPSLINADGTAREEFDPSENNGPDTKAQRITISQVGHLEYLILVCEGPESRDYKNQGFDMAQMAKLAHAFGVDNAYNLDGGSSACVSLNNQKLNSPSNPKIRSVGDCIYFATLVPNE